MSENRFEMIVCETHIEFAIDDFVDYHELAPDISILDTGLTCERCDQPAKYKLVGQS